MQSVYAEDIPIIIVHFSLHMHAKPSFTQRLQAGKMASSRTNAQNNSPRAQNNGPCVSSVSLYSKML